MGMIGKGESVFPEKSFGQKLDLYFFLGDLLILAKGWKNLEQVNIIGL